MKFSVREKERGKRGLRRERKAYGVKFIIGKIPVQTPISAGAALELNLSEAPGDPRVESISRTVVNIEFVRLPPR